MPVACLRFVQGFNNRGDEFITPIHDVPRIVGLKDAGLLLDGGLLPFRERMKSGKVNTQQLKRLGFTQICKSQRQDTKHAIASKTGQLGLHREYQINTRLVYARKVFQA